MNNYEPGTFENHETPCKLRTLYSRWLKLFAKLDFPRLKSRLLLTNNLRLYTCKYYLSKVIYEDENGVTYAQKKLIYTS